MAGSGQAVGRVQKLSKLHAVKPGTGGQGGTFHLYHGASLLPPVSHKAGRLAEKAVCRPGAAAARRHAKVRGRLFQRAQGCLVCLRPARGRKIAIAGTFTA